jgi:oligosaccharide reducing-end xylanase
MRAPDIRTGGGASGARPAGWLRARAAHAAHAALGALVGLAGLPACQTTVDSLGYNGPAGIELHRLTGPATYPNAFRDLLGKTDAEIAAKIAGAFAQLFHGDPATQAIYFPVGADRAYIQDILHADVRTEGIGYGMIIAVQLDKRDEFDRLWTYAKTMLAITTGPARGYFPSFCDTRTGTFPCLDPFGLQQFLMALLFANDRWAAAATPAAPATIDYAADAKALLNVMRHKQDDNGGIVAGVTDTFDAAAKLVFDVPNISAADVSRPAIAMPAYYDLWAQATGDPFWTQAGASARAYWQRAAHPVTGFRPVRARFSGAPLPGSDTFEPEEYRTQLNIALDQIWSGGDPWNVAVSDRLLRFFVAEGIDSYGTSYTLDGTTTLNAAHEPSLVVMNGASALIATVDQRAAFIDAVWNMPTPSGVARYYAGILDLLSLLILGGQLRVY